MYSFIKEFHNKVPKQVRTTILAMIAMLAVVLNLINKTDVMDILKTLAPLVLVVFAVYLLAKQGEEAAAHLMLFLLVFSSGFPQLFNGLLSYQFAAGQLTTVTWQMILSAVVSVYLLLLCLSFIFNQGIKLSIKPDELLIPFLLLAVYVYVDNGFGSLVLTFIPIMIAFGVGSKLATLALMLRVAIDVPFDALDYVIDGRLKFSTLQFWAMAVFAFYLIYLFVKIMIKEIKKSPSTETLS